MQKKNIKLITLMVLTFVASVVMSLPTPASALNSNGLGITPRKDYLIEAGKKASDTIYVKNLSATQDLLLTLKVVDFSAQDESGAPNLDLRQDHPQTPWSLKPFIKMPNTVRVAAGKSVDIPVTITIPTGQGAGSYYSAIEYAAQNDVQQQKLNVEASSATLMFVNVPGQATENVKLLQFGTYEPAPDDKSGSFKNLFLMGTPKEFAYRIKNEGNVAEQPSGSILVKNMFGKQAAEIKEINPKKQLALRGQTRRLELCVKPTNRTDTVNGQPTQTEVCDSPHLWPGRYSAQLDAFYGLPGSPQQEILAKATFWYLPWWFLVIVLGVIALIVWGVLALSRKLGGGKRKRSSRR